MSNLSFLYVAIYLVTAYVIKRGIKPTHFVLSDKYIVY